MAWRVALIFEGLLAWTFLEYVIHGWLSHRLKTFAGRFHAVHHHNPNNVFAIRAWLPLTAIWLGLTALFGLAPGMLWFDGVMLGFIGYEGIHYRLHFCQPSGNLESYLRARHLLHHAHPNRYFGVTSPLWDLVFCTESPKTGISESGKRLNSIHPLSGPTNFHKLTDFLLSHRFTLIKSS